MEEKRQIFVAITKNGGIAILAATSIDTLAREIKSSKYPLATSDSYRLCPVPFIDDTALAAAEKGE